MDSGFDIVLMGHLSRDLIVFEGTEEVVMGGAVVYSSVAAARSGARVLAVTRCAESDRKELGPIAAAGAKLVVLDSPKTTSIRNVYHTPDREKRTVTLLSRAAAFTPDELPDDPVRIVHLAGLFVGELPDELIARASGRAAVALDVQGVLRTEEDGALIFRDWRKKRQYLPLVTYLKTDAAEAAIMTGTEDREKAAQLLGAWGATEVMITHNSEVLVWSDGELYRAPLTPRNLSGRTGRGDTCFAAYLARRLEHDIDDSVRYAAALVSIKMEKPGVFTGTVEEVEQRMEADS